MLIEKKTVRIHPLVRLSGTRSFEGLEVPNFQTCSHLHDVLETQLASVEIHGQKHPIFLNVKDQVFRVALEYDVLYPDILVTKSLKLLANHVVSALYFH